MEIREMKISYRRGRKFKGSIRDPQSLHKFLKKLIDKDREMFLVIHFNGRMVPESYKIEAIGTLDTCVIHPREVFKGAILGNASSIILAHNHPSGIAEPSKEDKAIALRLYKVGEILGIELLDFVIIGGDNIWSAAESGLLKDSGKPKERH